ncbi:hypothetical protein KAI52_03455 [Candidatus Parcubacteria bacterium]|nr:hypothetical protein [Candidatus Parcubacteria bacterium]
MKTKFLIGIIGCLLFVSPAKAGDISAGAQAITKSSAGLNLSQIFEGSEPQQRQLPFNPSLMLFQADQQHFEKATLPYNFNSFQEMVRHKPFWTRTELETIIYGQKFAQVKVDNYFNQIVDESEQSEDDVIQILIQENKPFNKIVIEIGAISVLGKGYFDHSRAVGAMAAIEALNMGGKTLIVSGEGANRRMESGGFNLGVLSFLSAISGGTQELGGGGSGSISGGKGNSEYVHLPYGHFKVIIHFNKNEYKKIINEIANE